MFINITRCPFCKSNKSKKVIINIDNNFYIKEILFDLNITFQFLKKKLKIKQCLRCNSIYFSSWFNNNIKKKIFLSIYGQHNYGWQNFYNFEKKLETVNHGNLFETLKKKIKFKSYGEYGCPFNGLMFDILKDEISNRNSLKKFINLSINHLSSKVRNFKKKNYKRKKIKLPTRKNIYKKFFLLDNSHLIWGRNDVSNNCSSLALADKLFSLNLLDFSEKEFEKKKIDLFGFFMTLDHSEEPFVILKSVLKKSRFVIIHAHISQSISAQHTFTFTKKIQEFLNKKKIYCENLTGIINKDRNRNKGIDYQTNQIYLLCSKNKKKLKNINIKSD